MNAPRVMAGVCTGHDRACDQSRIAVRTMDSLS